MNNETDPIFLSLVMQGTVDFPRFVIADQNLRYWADGSWVLKVNEAVLYSDVDTAVKEINRLLMTQYGSKQKFTFQAFVNVDVYSDKPIDVKSLQLWLMQVSRFVMAYQQFGNGPLNGSLGLTYVDWSTLKKYDSSNTD